MPPAMHLHSHGAVTEVAKAAMQHDQQLEPAVATAFLTHSFTIRQLAPCMRGLRLEPALYAQGADQLKSLPVLPSPELAQDLGAHEAREVHVGLAPLRQGSGARG